MGRAWLTLEAYNVERRRLRRRCLCSGLAIIALLLAATAKVLWPAVACLLVFAVAAAGALHSLHRLRDFRCPHCGEDPTSKVASDPAKEFADHAPFSTHCLHCRSWLGGDG